MVWWWTPMFWWWFSGVWWLNPFFCPIIAPLPVAGGMFAPEVLAQWELRPTSSWRKAQSGPWRSQESSSKVWRFPMSWRVSPNDPKSDHLSIKTYGFHLFPYIYIYVYMCDFPFQTIHFGTPPLMDPSPPSQASQVALGVKKPRPVRPHRPRSTRRRGSAKCLAFFADGMMGPTWTKNGWFYRLCHRKFAENCEKGDLSTKKYWFKCLKPQHQK